MKLKKQFVSSMLMLALLSLIVSGCGGKQEETPKNTPQGAKVMELKLHHHDPPGTDFGAAVEQWAKLVGEKTNGRVKVTVYPAGTLGPANTAYDMVVNGVADIAWGFVGLFPGRFPMTELIGMPMMGIHSAEMGTKILWELYTSTDFLKKEFADVHVITMHTHTAAPIGLNKKKITTAADMKGLKLRSPGGGPMLLLKELGASPMTVPPGDIYQAMERGVIEGYTLDWQGVHAFKLTEVSKYVLDADLYVGPFFLVMNKKVWDSLTPEDQKAIDSISGEYLGVLLAKAFDSEKQKVLKEKGFEIYKLSEEENAKWMEMSKGIADKYVQELEAKGQPARETLAKIRELVAKYSR
ncbi:MAG: TRAP transporter substrate-binding protein [Peptococcaceae bacterium]|nr:TRAP transporter substrate-binding protein [Peptococcaceae bacterium]